MSGSTLSDARAVIIANRVLELLFYFYDFSFELFVGFFKVDGRWAWQFFILLHIRIFSSKFASFVWRGLAQLEIEKFTAAVIMTIRPLRLLQLIQFLPLLSQLILQIFNGLISFFLGHVHPLSVGLLVFDIWLNLLKSSLEALVLLRLVTLLAPRILHRFTLFVIFLIILFPFALLVGLIHVHSAALESGISVAIFLIFFLAIVRFSLSRTLFLFFDFLLSNLSFFESWMLFLAMARSGVLRLS